MKGAGAFLVVFVGLLLLWVVLAGKAGNLSAAANVLTGSATATNATTTGASAGTALGITSADDAALLNAALVPTSSVSYGAASAVSPTGLLYA